MAHLALKRWMLAVLVVIQFTVALIIPSGFLSDTYGDAMLLSKRQTCIGPVICDQTSDQCLTCEQGYYCVGSSSCCPVGSVCLGDVPTCINAGGTAPSETQVCPTNAPICTTANNVPVCSGTLDDWLSISASLDGSANIPPPPPDTSSAPEPSSTPEPSTLTSAPPPERPFTSSRSSSSSRTTTSTTGDFESTINGARTTPPRTLEENSSSTPPASSSSRPPSENDSGSNPNDNNNNNNSSNNSETLKIGLGVGLGLGIPLLILAGATLYLLGRRYKKLDTAPLPNAPDNYNHNAAPVGGIQNMEYLAGSGIAGQSMRYGR